jgi:hypothetical protein
MGQPGHAQQAFAAELLPFGLLNTRLLVKLCFVEVRLASPQSAEMQR